MGQSVATATSQLSPAILRECKYGGVWELRETMAPTDRLCECLRLCRQTTSRRCVTSSTALKFGASYMNARSCCGLRSLMMYLGRYLAMQMCDTTCRARVAGVVARTADNVQPHACHRSTLSCLMAPALALGGVTRWRSSVCLSPCVTRPWYVAFYRASSRTQLTNKTTLAGEAL